MVRQGDRRQGEDGLRSRIHQRRIDGFVDSELARSLEDGEKTAREELPCLSGPDAGVPS